MTMDGGSVMNVMKVGQILGVLKKIKNSTVLRLVYVQNAMASTAHLVIKIINVNVRS